MLDCVGVSSWDERVEEWREGTGAWWRDKRFSKMKFLKKGEGGAAERKNLRYDNASTKLLDYP